jgi:2-polyprenyl-3-methyl-5-hydroxy-6-metoxy-1,4-benzoquinol methylase
MSVSDQQVMASHLEGGNYFDDMRINISESHHRFDNLPKTTQSIKQSKYRNLAKLSFIRLCIKFGFHEFLVVNGIRRRWLDDFRNYWSNVLNGRPFWNTLDFFMLLHDYRKRQQQTSQLEWDDATQHLANWQHPNQIYTTLHSVRNLAIHPIVNLHPFKKMPPKARILEYGCSLAPYYACYRDFFSHLNCRWVLGDIPNYPFHYAKYLYRNDAEVEFVTINAEDFSHPLGDTGEFDVIILTTVLEHLDDPLFISEYLLNRLKPGGLFVFDYIKSDGKGLDHPNALKTREDCIEIILKKTQVIYGRIDDITKSIGLCISQKQ